MNRWYDIGTNSVHWLSAQQWYATVCTGALVESNGTHWLRAQQWYALVCNGMHWCTGGQQWYALVRCNGQWYALVHWWKAMVCTGALVERLTRRRLPATKPLQPIAPSIFYILRGSWPVMLNMALLTSCILAASARKKFGRISAHTCSALKN